ncbi:MAG TPA: hypothetical protein VF629_09305 [Hymenobacter sp.]|jgi:hypothetical protein|uniref:hypothetical protein n=1 Tax=Hymenobacter sp. TaxID=1898978 RepID=UPI002ED91A1F
MKNIVPGTIRTIICGGFMALGCVSCMSSTADAPWQQAAVTSYLQQDLAVPASYQPVRWGPITSWRLGAIAKSDLPMARRRYVDAAAAVRHDSADFELVAQTAAQLGTPASDVALVEKRYRNSARERDTCLTQFQELIAAQNDTTLVFYRLAHTYTFKDEEGQTIRDSVQFNVGKQGVVVPFRSFRIAPATTESTSPASSLPPPPPLKHF